MVRRRRRAMPMTAPRPRSRQQPKQLDAGDLPGRDQFIRPAPGRRGQGRQDDPDLYRGGAVVRRRRPAGQSSRLGAGHQPRHPAVDGMAAGPLQQRLRQQPVPRPAAVLQMARRRGPAARPDGRTAAAARGRQAGPGVRPPGSWPGWSRRARAAASPSAATPRSSRYSPRPASGCPGWPACGAVTSTCGSGR